MPSKDAGRGHSAASKVPDLILQTPGGTFHSSVGNCRITTTKRTVKDVCRSLLTVQQGPDGRWRLDVRTEVPDLHSLKTEFDWAAYTTVCSQANLFRAALLDFSGTPTLTLQAWRLKDMEERVQDIKSHPPIAEHSGRLIDCHLAVGDGSDGTKNTHVLCDPPVCKSRHFFTEAEVSCTDQPSEGFHAYPRAS